MENIFRNLELDFDIDFGLSMKSFPLFLWQHDEFLDIAIGFNAVTYTCFEPCMPKDLIMNLGKLEMYFLCTWYFHQKKVGKLCGLFADNMFRNTKCAYKYLMYMTDNTYFQFISRFAAFIPDYDFLKMSMGLFKLDIQTNILASRVDISRFALSNNSYEDYRNRLINFEASDAVPSMMHRIIMRIHMIQHSFRTEIEAGFLWFACMYIACEDLICLATWLELKMIGKRMTHIQEIDVENVKIWKKQCYDLSLGIMSFGHGILKVLNMVVDKINGEEFVESIHKKKVEIPPESLFGLVGVEMFRVSREWYPYYAQNIKVNLKRDGKHTTLTYSSKLRGYAPLTTPDDYGCIVVNGMNNHYNSVLMNKEFILFEGLEQILCDPLQVIRNRNRAEYVDYQWIYGCDFHTSTMTKVMNAAYKGGFEKNSSSISISLFPINYKYLYDNSLHVKKIASKFNNCNYFHIWGVHLDALAEVPYGPCRNFIETLEQHILVKILLTLHWGWQMNYSLLVDAIAHIEYLVLPAQ